MALNYEPFHHLNNQSFAVPDPVPAPTGPNSFVFTYISTKKHPHQRSAPPYMGRRSPNVKSRIHSCFVLWVSSTEQTILVRQTTKNFLYKDSNLLRRIMNQVRLRFEIKMNWVILVAWSFGPNSWSDGIFYH